MTEIVHTNEVVTWQSQMLRDLGVRHGFSTRLGGVSEGPFAALNLALQPAGAPRAEPGEQDDPQNVEINYRLFREALECPKSTLTAWVTQVHGRRVELIDREGESEYSETLEAEIRDRFAGQLSADGIVSVVPEVLVTIRIADCVPILLSSEDGRVVAAVHAGWRGVVGNIIGKAVRTMHEAGGDRAAPARLLAVIGPRIGVKHFEVGEEVAAEFRNQQLADAVRLDQGPKPHIDLGHAVSMQLQRAGVARIDDCQLCTFHEAERFFSHRRDHGITGRMAAAIMATAAP